MRQVERGQGQAVPPPRDARSGAHRRRTRGIICRNLMDREDRVLRGRRGLLATGGYSTVFYLSTNAVNSNATATWRATSGARYFANPCYTQIHPTCIPLSGESSPSSP
jgi:succinate dehydrogenase / fumarate reductase flavoprotein subunit